MMHGDSKLMLSDGELQLVSNTEWILTKRKIIETSVQLLGVIADYAAGAIKLSELPNEIKMTTPKISRGENYQQLPYVILDYPRHFGKEDIFAVRTMFWWGHGFSCTLHLAGKYKQDFVPVLQQKIDNLQQNGFYVCINTQQWEHHFDEDNYAACRDLKTEDISGILHRQQFIKLAVQFPLQQWNRMEQLLEKAFADILHLLQD